MDNKELWGKALVDIELEVSKANFSTWFKNTRITKQDAGTVYVGVQNEFVRDWLSNKYHLNIIRVLRNVSPDVKNVEYVIAKEDTGDKGEHVVKKDSFSPFIGELPLQDTYVGKEDGLNPRYTFDSFVIGPFNELAYAAAQAVLKKPGIMYNPLFIYGSTGFGKTHLTQSIGNGIKKQNPGKRVQYVSSEKFSTDYVTSLQNNRVNEFKDKYRKYDVLIMDDIQFLVGKEKTQEELFHLYNALYENNKQIIFSSDKHPNYINGLEDRLKSRFGSGMIVEITMPEYESRLAILQEKLKQQQVIVPDEIVQYVAETIQASIRELEGTLNLVICQSQLKNKPLSLNEIKTLIKNNAKPTKPVSIKDIVKTVTSFYNIDERFIFEKTRRKEVVKPRQVLMYILRQDFNISYPLIGQKLGGRDHTTVIHSCEKIKVDIKTDSLLMQEIEQIRALF
ncbi:MAG: Chromosomal replication initiator protein DnaA [Parcubacteria group bacterium GW2011_GWA2_47_7]|nr:MAG: Chromosomal replication initiator protein DnaA [Parcubacteria group bacterium GW2011_GWA2_47_7]